ncbi:MAG: adenylate/guanylate cyclase domain-containing protein [Spirochaetes bacterium]|nr:adenylate/guanylate cyclase domain-containing protein [Spirochaetota bacterium]
MEKHFVSLNEMMKFEESKGERIALVFMIFISIAGGAIIFISRKQITKIALLAFSITIPLFIIFCIIEYLYILKNSKYRYGIKFISNFLFGAIVFLNLIVLFGYRTYKTPIFSLFYLLIGLSALRFSSKLSIFTTILVFLFINLLIIISIITKNVKFGILQEAYISEKVSLLSIYVNLVFMLILGFIQYYIAERYRFVMRQSIIAEVEKLKKESEFNYVKNMFSRYVSMQVVEVLMKNEYKIINEKRFVTILFCDLKDFTKISESLKPDQVVDLLNKFFSIMIEIIFYFNGTLDKFIGDAIMAIFGAPIDDEKKELNSILAAITMKKALKILNEYNKKRNYPELHFRIGIDSGLVVAGNIGSEKRMEYTVIGHTVNCASRIEQLNKLFETDILISKSTFEKISEFIEYEQMKKVRLKGIEEEIETYKVNDIKYIYYDLNEKIEICLKKVFEENKIY